MKLLVTLTVTHECEHEVPEDQTKEEVMKDLRDFYKGEGLEYIFGSKFDVQELSIEEIP